MYVMRLCNVQNTFQVGSRKCIDIFMVYIWFWVSIFKFLYLRFLLLLHELMPKINFALSGNAELSYPKLRRFSNFENILPTDQL